MRWILIIWSLGEPSVATAEFFTRQSCEDALRAVNAQECEVRNWSECGKNRYLTPYQHVCVTNGGDAPLSLPEVTGHVR